MAGQRGFCPISSGRQLMAGRGAGGSPTGGVSTPVGAEFPGGAAVSVVSSAVAGSGAVTVVCLLVVALFVDGAGAGLLATAVGLAVVAVGVGAAGSLAGAVVASSETVRTCRAGWSGWLKRDTAVTPPMTPAAASAANPTAKRLAAVLVTPSSVPDRFKSGRNCDPTICEVA